MPYLQGPHIQLGFYWHELPDVDAYRQVLRWLVDHGYKMSPVVHTISPEAGRLPRFSQIAMVGIELPETQTRVFGDWDIERAFTSVDWLPVEIRLLPTRSENVEVDLGYAMMYQSCLSGHEPHAIELIASGEDIDVLANSYPGDLSPEVVRRAHRTDAWCNATFRQICRDLSPDYAKCYEEHALQPPTGLINSTDYLDYCGLYLSEKRFGPAGAIRAAPRLATWQVHQFAHGLYIGRCEEARPSAAQPGVEFLRGLFEAAF